MGEGIVAESPHIIVSEGIGSCVVVMLYDIKLKIGGMAHVMLPYSEMSEMQERNSGLFAFADTAIDALMERLRMKGALLMNVEAKMAGGAKLFPSYKGSGMGIGHHNVISIKRILQRKLITLEGWDIGGHHGRSVKFYLDSGRVVVSALQMGDREI